MSQSADLETRITAWGKTKSIAAWARDPRASGDAKTILKRYQSGMLPEAAIGFQKGDDRILPLPKNVIMAWGKAKTIAEWATDPICTVSSSTIHYRLKKGWTSEDAISKPASPRSDVVKGKKKRRKIKTATAFGETKTHREWLADPRCKASRYALLGRLKTGWDAETAISTPNLFDGHGKKPAVRRFVTVTAFGETKSLVEWAKDPRCNISATGLSGRLREGMSPEEAIATPSKSRKGWRESIAATRGPFPVTAWGETKDLRHWGRDPRCKVSTTLVRMRIMNGYEPEVAISSPLWTLQAGRKKALYEAFGEQKTVVEWAQDPRTIVPIDTLRNRLRMGWEPELAMTRPIDVSANLSLRKGRKFTAFGLTMNLKAWSKHPLCRCSYAALVGRVRDGADFELALTTLPGAIDIEGGRNLEDRRYIAMFGEKKTKADWLRDPRRVATRDAFLERLYKGWDPEEAFLTPKMNGGFAKGTIRPDRSIKVTAWGETKAIVEWVRDPRCSVGRRVVAVRLRTGWTPEDAIGRPARVTKATLRARAA